MIIISTNTDARNANAQARAALLGGPSASPANASSDPSVVPPVATPLVTPGFAFALEHLSHPATLSAVLGALEGCVPLLPSLPPSGPAKEPPAGPSSATGGAWGVFGTAAASMAPSSQTSSSSNRKPVTLAPKRAAGGPRVPAGFHLPADAEAALLAANHWDLRLWRDLRDAHAARLGIAVARRDLLAPPLSSRISGS